MAGTIIVSVVVIIRIGIRRGTATLCSLSLTLFALLFLQFRPLFLGRVQSRLELLDSFVLALVPLPLPPLLDQAVVEVDACDECACNGRDERCEDKCLLRELSAFTSSNAREMDALLAFNSFFSAKLAASMAAAGRLSMAASAQ